jgi:hypothetical protein
MGLVEDWLPFLVIGIAFCPVIAIILWDAREENRSAWTRQDRFSLFGLLFNLTTLIAAIIGVTVAFNAFKQTKRQANTAELQIGIAKDTAKRQLRAYVYVTPDGLKNLGKDERPQGGVTVHMIGQTPAYDLELLTTIGTLPYPLTKKIEEFTPSRPTELTHSILFPGLTFNNSPTLTYVPTDQQMTVIKQADPVRIFVWGSVTYKDTFLERHHVLFCFNYDKAAVAGERGPQICDRHVEAD